MNAALNIIPLFMPSTKPSLAGFDEFWKAYPRKVSKLLAMKAWSKALKLATAEQIMAGVEQYKKHKPEYADWAFPASWLNAGRWMDEWEQIIQPPKKQGNF